MPKRASDREQHTSPPSTAHRIQPHPRSFRQQDESDDRQARQRADHQRQHQKYLVFTLLQLGHAIKERVLHQLPLVVWPLPLISGECPTKSIPHRMPMESGRESWGAIRIRR